MRLLTIDFELSGRIANKGELITATEQQQLKNDVITVMNKIRIDAERGRLDENQDYKIQVMEIRLTDAEPKIICEDGYIRRVDSCVACAPGTFFNVVNETCEVCPMGTYQPSEAANTCLVCPDFTSTTSNNSKSITQCKGQCLPGTFSPDGLELCETCPIGKYQSQYASRSCVPCPNGTTTWGRGTRQVTKCGEMCPAGYVSRDGLAPCFPCPRGHFQSDPGRSSCFRCPGAVNTAREAATDILECEGITHHQVREYDAIPTSELTVNECFKSPCQNNATCESMDVGFLCHCQPGWSGVQCETEIDECASNPCFNNATCRDMMDAFKCVCLPGFEGLLCDENIDECSSNPCLHNATCVDDINQYRCECVEGYEGMNCEINEDDCRGSPCQHGGTCIDHVAAYSCNCVAGFEGEHCEINIDECNSSPCQNNATCVDLVWAYKCTCLPGYTGQHCEMEINECVSDPCYVGATCQDLIAKYNCVCPPAYSGVHCEEKLNSTFDLYFAHNSGLTDYVALDGVLPSLSEVTIAFWMRANYTGNYGTPLSYATDAEANAMTITDYDGIVISLDGEKVISDIKVSDGLWHHMAVTWESNNGAWAIYLDGVLEEQGHYFARGRKIQGGGVVVLGQEQDARGGQFNSKESFVGHLSRLNIWNYKLPKETIVNIMNSCEEYIGSVLAWPDFLAGIHGRVQRQDSHLCKGCKPPNNVTSGSVTWNGTATGDLTQYSCDVGYRILGSKHRTCRVNSTWDGTEPSCERVKCTSRPYIANGRITTFVNTYGSSMKFTCNKGYRMAGNDTLFCNEMGAWEGEMPHCEEIICPDVELTPNVLTIPRRRFGSARPGNTTRFSCKTGYTLVGDKTVRCLHTGTWSAPFPICNISLCRKPPLIPHGQPKHPDRVYEYGQSAEYQCEVGYTLGSYGALKCMSTGRWSIYRPSCKKIQCKPLTPIRHGKMHGNDFFYGSIVSYTCNEGYALNGSATLICTENGSWNDTKPNCVINACPVPEPVQHGSVTLGEQGVNTTAVYRCDSGFVLKGSFMRRCLPNGTWDRDPPRCELIRCMAPEPVQYGTIEGDEFFFGMYANFSCNPGYVLIGKPDIRCGDNGSWINPAPICAPVTCPDPLDLEHGTVIGKSFLNTDTIEFVCDIGYELVGAKKRICQSNATWSGLMPTCEPVKCQQPVPIEHGKYEVAALDPGSVVKYKCDVGYEIEGKPTRTCKSDGTWTGPIPKCVSLRCNYPEQIRHGQFIAHDNRYGANIKYICDDGYELIGPESRTCTTSREWNGTSPQCQEIKCDPPPAIANGKHIGVNYTIGATIRYKCEPGYVLDHDGERRCGENKTWLGAEPKCIPIECEGPSAAIPNGKMINTTFTFNTTILYTCNEGYFTDDTPNRTCQADGSWLNPVPVCEPVRCPAPDRIANGHVNGSDHFFNKTVRYMCDKGFGLVGGAIRTCLANGTWQGKAPECQPITCQRLFSPINGDVKMTGVNYGDVATYTCKTRYELVGDETRLCDPDGRWSGEQPLCKPVICDSPPPLLNGEVLFRNIRAGDVVQYLCNPGFVLSQSEELLCTEHGNYSGNVPRCERVHCKPPLKIRHGIVSSNGTRFGDYAHYACQPGYNRIGDWKLFCDEKGRWIGNVPRCAPVQCPILPPIKYGWYAKHLTYEFGTNVTFHCDIGYQVVGDKYVVCQENATWSSLGPVCELKQCPTPNIQNGIITVKKSLYKVPPGRSEYFYGMTIQIDCQNGYNLNGVSELRCLSSARWTFDVPQCVPVTCDEPEIEKAVIQSTKGFSYNETIAISCIEGYVLVGEAKVTCQADMAWSPALPKCVTATCVSPYLDNGEFRVHKSPNTGFGYPFGIVLLFTCNEGYFLEGSETLTCDSDAKWSDEYPVCKPVTCEAPVLDLDHAPIMLPVLDLYKYGDAVRFRCESRYRLVGDEVLYCFDDGLWNGTLPTCIMIECPPINPSQAHVTLTIDNSTLVPTGTTRFIQGSMINITCNLGYRLDANSELFCTSNGTWSAPVPVCQPVRCAVPEVNHGRVSPPRGDISNYGVGTSVDVSCDKGYTIADNFRITCLPNGTWSDRNVACTAITCEVPEVDAATVVSKRRNGVTHFTVDDEIRIICLSGYLLIGENDRFRCTEKGTWDKPIPRCEKLRCKTPVIDNAHVLLNGQVPGEDSIYQFGDAITIKCDDGYAIVGSTELKCTSSARWSPVLPSCTPVHCPALYIEHGLVVADQNSYGSVVHVECEMGYELFGDTELTCTGRGEWSGVIPICAMIECPKPVVKHGKVLGRANVTYSFGSIISYQCDEGYVLLGERESLCLPDASWSEGPPTCQRVICKKPPEEIDFGSIEVVLPDDDEDFSFGSVLKYKCELGYGLDGLAELTCESNGQWTSDFPICVQNVCPYPLIENGYADGRARGRNGEYVFGDTVRFKCRPGFERVGTPEMFCDPDGNWTDDFPTCVRIQCPDPAKIDNGTVRGEAYLFGDVVVYSCDEGFELHGSAEVTCLADGTWSVLPSCSVILCQLPVTIEHGMYLATGLRYGDKIRYACNSGYELFGEDEHRCLANRSWSGSVPECLPVKCRDPIPPLLNGKPILEQKMMTDVVYVYLDKVHYRCLEGYDEEGSGFVQCDASGKWSVLDTKCTLVSCVKPQSIDNGRLMEGKHVYGSSVEYRCDHGYSMEGIERIWCTAMGKWNGTVPTCLPVPCHYPDIPDHGELKTDRERFRTSEELVKSLPSGFHFGDLIDYACDTGYRIGGQSKLECIANGTWSSEAPDCVRMKCIDVPDLPDAFVNGSEGSYGDKLAVECDLGYRLLGVGYVECGANQNWIFHDTACEMIRCPDPPPIENGLILGDVYLYNKSIEYQCTEGYRLVGDGLLTCLESGHWSGTTPSCTPVMCPVPDPIQDGYYETDSGSTMQFGVTLNYFCDDGHELVGKDSVTCQANGDWSASFPECVKIHCPDPDPIPHGRILGGLVHRYEDAIEYSCDVGYEMVGESLRTCSASGTWSGLEPSCVLVRCPPPKRIANGKVSGKKYTYNSGVSYSCDQLYFLVGEERRTCQSNGSWSAQEPVCKLKTCPRPPDVENGRIVGTNYSAGASITYVCDPGHRISGSAKLVCLGDGWDDDSPQCRRVSCGQPPAVKHATVRSSSYYYGDEVLYGCLKGYEAIGKERITCQANGTWSSVVMRCSRVSCGQPPNISHGFSKPEGTRYGDLVVYGCEKGYQMSGNNLLECLSDARWGGHLPVCREIECGGVPVIPHASVIVSRKTFMSVARYLCNSGYVIRGSDQVECMANGSWTYDERPACLPVDCGRPPQLENGSFKVSGSTLGNKANYFCQEGYRLHGGRYLRCVFDGTWNGTAPECRPVVCPRPTAPQNGRVQGSVFLFGSDIVYSCQSGFQLVGDAVRTCMSDGDWGGQEPRCDLIYCPPLDLPEHGNITFTDRRHYGSKAIFLCEHGYELVGNATLMCTVDGVWNDTAPECISEVTTCPSPSLPPNVIVVHGEFVVGDTIVLQCEEGYQETETMTITCQDDTWWTEPRGRCQRLSCGVPKNQPWVVILGSSFNFGDKVMYMCRQGLTPATEPVLICGKDGKWDKTPRCLATCTFPCENGGTCVGRNICKCASGFAGRFCGEAICVLPCLHGGKCTGPYRCTCPYGFSGARCEKRK
ncbi:hypothetical protein LSH36_413g01017 [Paralvinella palmiformis]|uniref:Sushi, von Willebrand factor type A, EGF and pentraxin domain-containing protein 1 n=1 Tax=Paralvinella palmiformis TaxID=53620 RepID=A0AAD9MZV9_9ANNE|nr:hypothetical protein LSH36_413g01017 [Paralvinella palmiformis]